MASGLLFMAVVFFAARGFFLGLPGVFARLLGLISGYVVAFSYRDALAKALATHLQDELPPLLLQVISGAVLFFGSMFLISFIITGIFKLLAKLIPPLRGILTKEATGSRIAGAVFNGAIGAALVLAGIWLYGITLGKNQHPDQLQQFANRFDDSLISIAQFALAKDAIDAEEKTISQSAPADSNPQISKGSAEIVSSSDPQKRVSIESIRKLMTDTTTRDVDISTLLQNEQLQNLINDPAVREKALKYLQDNPQQMMEALNNPKFRALLDEMESQ